MICLDKSCFLFLFAIPKCIKVIAKNHIKETFVFYDQLMIKAKFKLLLEIWKFRKTFIFFFLPNFRVTTENVLEYLKYQIRALVIDNKKMN